MTSVLLFIALSLVAYLGFALLAMSQKRPWQQVSQVPPPTSIRRLTLRTLGGLALLSALVLCVVRDGPSFGALLWATTISIAAATVAFTLTWAPAWLRPLAKVAAMRGRAPCVNERNQKSHEQAGAD